MVRGEPIRWQIRCQLRGSCLETITASLPPQFKFQTSPRSRVSPRAQPASRKEPASRTLPNDAAGPAGQQIKENPHAPGPKGSIFTARLLSWTG